METLKKIRSCKLIRRSVFIAVHFLILSILALSNVKLVRRFKFSSEPAYKGLALYYLGGSLSN